MANNKGILVLIAVVLVAILGVMVMQKDGGFFDRRTGLEKAADGVGEAVEEVGDEIDDATTNRN